MQPALVAGFGLWRAASAWGSGVLLQLNGTVTGSLTIEAGGKLELRGTIFGALVNYGECDVWGVVHGPIYDEEGGGTRLHPGAVHDSDIST